MACSNLIKLLTVCCIYMSSVTNGEQCVLIILPLSLTEGTNYSDVTGSIIASTTPNKGALKFLLMNSESEYAAVVQFVSNVFDISFETKICSELIGVVGDLDSKTASIISTLASRSNLTFTLVAAVAPSTFPPVTNLALPNVLDMNPLPHYVEALITFIDYWNWTRIGLITDHTYYYQYASELLYTRFKENTSRVITPLVRMRKNESRIATVQRVKEHGTHITILSMGLIEACSIMREAQKLAYTWPEYAWIMFPLRSYTEELMTECDMEGVIFLQDRVVLSNFDNVECNDSYTEYEEACKKVKRSFSPKGHGFFATQCNNCANTFYDSLLAVTLADRLNFSNASFPGFSGPVKFRKGKRLNQISVIQMLNSSGLEISYFDPELQALTVTYNLYESGSVPQGITSIVYANSSTVFISLVITPCAISFGFLTAVLILYIYFRHEPEIKATSVTISLCMFLGCYLVLLLVPVLVIELQPATNSSVFDYIICNLLAWLSGLGIPFSLILSTLFVKMLRVYVIFCKPNSYKKKFFSDASLLLYIVLLISPNIIILLFWSATDPLTNIVGKNYGKDVLYEGEVCESQHTLIWLGLLLFYIIILIISVVVLSFKTAEIRYKNFRDTKETNAFAFLTIFVIVMLLFYWLFLRAVDNPIPDAADITLFVAHITLSLLCPIFLFVPKVYSPIKRRLYKNTVKSKNSTTASTLSTSTIVSTV